MLRSFAPERIGTLAIVTQIILRLVPKPAVQSTLRATFRTVEDAAITGGLGRFRGRPVVVMGHEKGNDTTSRLHASILMAGRHQEGGQVLQFGHAARARHRVARLAARALRCRWCMRKSDALLVGRTPRPAQGVPSGPRKRAPASSVTGTLSGVALTRTTTPP